MKRHSMACMFGGLMILAGTATAGDVVIDLKNGVVTETFNTAPAPAPQSSTATSGFTDSAGYATVTLNKKTVGSCQTQYEAVVEVDLNPKNFPPVKSFRVQVEHEGTPTGWTTHLGGDAANNGFGGGNGLSGVAELQVLDQNLSVYTTGFNPGEVDRLYGSALRLTDGAYGFEVSDQSVTVGQPRTIIATANQKQLFDFSAPDKRLYAAFNRVIANHATRKGCGVKRVVLSFD